MVSTCSPPISVSCFSFLSFLSVILALLSEAVWLVLAGRYKLHQNSLVLKNPSFNKITSPFPIPGNVLQIPRKIHRDLQFRFLFSSNKKPPYSLSFGHLAVPQLGCPTWLLGRIHLNFHFVTLAKFSVLTILKTRKIKDTHLFLTKAQANLQTYCVV